LSRLPSMQFYPHDWLSDSGLRSCSLAARGLWLDILCVMWDAPERGIISRKVELNLSKVVGSRADCVKKLIAELEKADVFSRRDSDRSIYSRRMIQEELVRKQHRDSYYRTSTRFGTQFRRDSDAIRNDFGIHSSSSSSTSNLKTPLPPASGGNGNTNRTHDELLKDERNYSYMSWANGHIVIRTGRHHRVFTKNEASALVGSSIEHVVKRIREKGFWAEIYEPTGKIE
jgi:hypothetical protein